MRGLNLDTTLTFPGPYFWPSERSLRPKSLHLKYLREFFCGRNFCGWELSPKSCGN